MSTDFDKYADMLDLPHYQSPDRPHMSIHDRAAQFSSFAALTGHEEAIEETARLTDVWHDMDEGVRQRMDETLQKLLVGQGKEQRVTVTYFKPDTRKEGGAYETVSGKVRKIDTDNRQLMLEDGTLIPLMTIADIELL
ncbi:MAG: hypothetical protein KBS83_05075 [Lachnospiraceae bacterium]|nr:hypothetical protein [Candidatus Equihabitans merdae]